MPQQNIVQLWDLNYGSIFRSLDTKKTYTVKRFDDRMVEVKDENGKKWAWPNSAKVELVYLGEYRKEE